MQAIQASDNSVIQRSDRQNHSLIITSWVLIALVCLLAVVPVFGFTSWVIAAPILFITLVMGIIVLSRGGTIPGLFILLVSLIAAPVFIFVAPFVSSLLGISAAISSAVETSSSDRTEEHAKDILRNSSAEEKQRLLNQLRQSVPQNAGAILTDFVSNSAATGGQGGEIPSTPATLGRNESSLLNEIARIYSQQNDIITKSKQYLAGVPGDIQRRVLEDWHADAMGLNRDPDPGTDVNTRIDDRILRQLDQAGVSLDRLDRELRTRLSQAMR